MCWRNSMNNRNSNLFCSLRQMLQSRHEIKMDATDLACFWSYCEKYIGACYSREINIFIIFHKIKNNLFCHWNNYFVFTLLHQHWPLCTIQSIPNGLNKPPPLQTCFLFEYLVSLGNASHFRTKLACKWCFNNL